MQNKYIKFLIHFVIFFNIFCFNANADIINQIKINGNERIADETILMFSKINVGDDVDENDLNDLLKNLYDTTFFKNVSVSLDNKILKIFVEENPIIESILYNGIKSNTW